MSVRTERSKKGECQSKQKGVRRENVCQSVRTERSKKGECLGEKKEERRKNPQTLTE